VLSKAVKLLNRWLGFRSRINRSMRDRYSPAVLALAFCVLLALIAILTVFIPPYVGYSNDGSFDAVFKDVGLARLNPDDEDAYFNYYERVYRTEESVYRPDTTPLALKATVRAAMVVDALVSRDDLFDMRSLAALYLLMYLPAAFLLTRFAMERAETFSEGIVIGVLAVLIFGDVSLISRFASLYSQPLILISLMYVAATLIRLSKGPAAWPFVVLLPALAVLLSVNHYCGVGAFVFTALFILLFSTHKGFMWRLACVASAILIGIMGFAALVGAENGVTLTQRYNAMTRGILLKSSQPVDTLAEFGIDPRYSVLTDTYADQNYPVALMNAPALAEGYFDHYNTALIVSYYIRHPASMIGMIDIGVGASFDMRPSFSGNYEKSIGLPPKAKSPFLAAWSSFKIRSMPRTISYFLIMMIGVIAAYRPPRKQRREPWRPQNANPLRAVMLSVLLFALLQMTTAVVYSGDSEMVRESFVMGVANDLMFLFLISEILHRMNLIRQEDAL